MNKENKYRPRIAASAHALDVRGVRYCIHEWGDKSSVPVFYLHGWADTGSTFQFVADALGEDWRIIAPDWRGFGQSGRGAASYWFPDYLADLHAILDHYAPSGKVPILGHSMGGNIASLYAGTMPERVAALINIEGFGLSDTDPAEAPGRYREWITAAVAGPEFADYPDFGTLAKRIQKRSPALSDARAEFVARQWAKRDDDGRVRLRADPAHKLPNPVLYRRAESEACWKNITADVLLVRGETSPFAARFGSTASLPFPQARNEEIAAAGHMIHFEAPQRLADIARAFLAQTL